MLRRFIVAIILALAAWFFAGVLFRDELFAFRDTARFYYPLFQFCHDEWAAGRVPLWNPYDNGGQPLLGEGSASVLYPGQLVFLPMWLGRETGHNSFDWCFRVYVIGHVVFAAWAAARLAGHWRLSPAAAGLSAICYAFSGAVLFQHANVIYLVSAAWLPLALLATDRMLRQRRLRFAMDLAAVLAMMVLGGDPQMAYQALLLTAGLALAMWLAKKNTKYEIRNPKEIQRTETENDQNQASPPKAASGLGNSSFVFGACFGFRFSDFVLRGRRLVSIGLAGCLAAALSLVQLWPTAEFAARSTRAVRPTLAERFWAHTQPDTPLEEIYHFSVGPWRLAECVVPNCYGRQFPIHRRWLDVFAAEGRVWTPTLYFGLLPLVLALGSLRFRRASPALPCRSRVPAVFLTWTAVIAVAGSFGWFGLGWIINEASRGLNQPATCGEPVGGVYWLLTLVLPGYAWFRYPAKLFTVATLALSLLAARGFDGWMARPRRSLCWTAAALAVSSALLAATASLIGPAWDAWFAGVPPSPLFGDLDVAGARLDLLTGLVHTTLVAACVALLSWLASRRATMQNQPRMNANGHRCRWLCMIFRAVHGRIPRALRHWFGLRKTQPSPTGDTTTDICVHPCPSVAKSSESRPRRCRRQTRQWLAIAALPLLAVDLAVANGWTVATAPAALWHDAESGVQGSDVVFSFQFSVFSARASSLPLVKEPGVRAEASSDQGPCCARCPTGGARPQAFSWRGPGTTDFFDRQVAHDRRCGVPRYNLLDRVPCEEVESSLIPAADADRAELRQSTEHAFFYGALVSGIAWLAMAIGWWQAIVNERRVSGKI